MQATKKKPVPVQTDSRICFGLEWYATETDAKRAAKIIRDRGDTYNGGYFHGSPCGRETSFDYTDESGRKLFAVSTR